MVSIQPCPSPTTSPCSVVRCKQRARYFTYYLRDGLIIEVLYCLPCARRAVAHRAAKATRKAITSRN